MSAIHIKRTHVSSSQISSIGHDGNQTMVVEFSNGKKYSYHPVSPEMHRALMQAPSVGSHFSSNFKNKPGITARPL